MPLNEAALEGVLTTPPELRTTPAGRLVAQLILEHHEPHAGLDPIRELRLRMTVTAMGELAERCRTLQPGATLRAAGRLNQQRWIRREQVRWGAVELVARELAVIAPAPAAIDDKSEKDV